MNTRNHQVLFNGLVIHIEQFESEIGARGMHTFQVIRHPGGAGVLPVHDDGSVSLIRQLRPAVAAPLLEIPAGRLGPGEEPFLCAGRELVEETGLRAERLVPLGLIHSSPGVFDEIIHLYAATGLTSGIAEPEEDEEIEVVRLPFPEALRLAARGEISDAKTLAALFRWELALRGEALADA